MDFREIKRQHDALRSNLVRLKGALGDPAGRRSTDLVSEVHSLSNKLKSHFRFEEEGGYLQAVIEKRPGWSRRVDRLHDQHREILTELDDLAHKSESEVAEDLGRIIAMVEKHDTDESSLVQQVVTEDIGSGD